MVKTLRVDIAIAGTRIGLDVITSFAGFKRLGTDYFLLFRFILRPLARFLEGPSESTAPSAEYRVLALNSSLPTNPAGTVLL